MIADARMIQSPVSDEDFAYLIDRVRDCYDGIPLGIHVTTAPVPLLVLVVDALEKLHAANKEPT